VSLSEAPERSSAEITHGMLTTESPKLP
jgi:hypothetical protein